MNRVFVFGIDGAPPELIFDKWLDELPNIKGLLGKGIYSKVNSTIPPSTIVAWNSMFSGKDTSEIGVFSYTYNSNGVQKLVSSNNIKCDLIWDILTKQKKKTIALYVPLSYPVKPINGIMVSDFMTPGIGSRCTYPDHIKDRIKKYYSRYSEIIYPPVNVAKFFVSKELDNYFLMAGRLVAYKRFDLGIKAFAKLGLPLKIVGVGQ